MMNSTYDKAKQTETMTDLARWNGQLARHFAQLRTTRNAAGLDCPIFALEHGLRPSELQAIAEALRGEIKTNCPSHDHALPWIVYAAEIGYRYSGDEYWQTFEAETPGWNSNGDRDWIRGCFRAFQKTYGGAAPSGAWSEHFTIICWPITHAILPTDLQRQLARILYELRHSFSAELFESPVRLGEFIAARSWSATSRFQNFAQEVRLVGQIAAALLLQGEFGTDSLIHPATLERIGTDLDHERRAREWLRGAQRFARERAQIRGLSLGREPVERRKDEARAEIASLGIEPRLVLRPKDANCTSWETYLEIPDLSHLLMRFPKTRDVLTNTRCVVAGSSGRPLARGRLLHGTQLIVLTRWPKPDEILLQFEKTDPQLEYLLRTECLLRPGNKWLFRIASDALAYETRSLRVRPGERYILVSTDGNLYAGSHVRPIEIECEGINGVLLDLPAAISADWEETLRLLGLVQAKQIEVWPVGLDAVAWDGEGHGEWLASERPCLAIATDHPLAQFSVSMGATPETSLELDSVVPGEPIFVEFPELPVGVHTFRISACAKLGDEAQFLGDLDVVMRVREARPWAPGVNPHGPLVVEMDPLLPTLEQLWEGRVDVALRGPAGRRVSCIASLFESDGSAATLIKRLPPITLPLLPSEWRTHFEKYFREARDVQGAYDNARCCEVEFNAEELGKFTVRCEREFTPLRWVVSRSGAAYTAHLFDDSGASCFPSVAYLSFETPCVEKPLVHTSLYNVPPEGGLYVGRQGGSIATVVIPPSHVTANILDWHRFRQPPHIDLPARTPEALIRNLAFARLWSDAKLSGDLFSSTRQRDVLLALAQQNVRLVCGERWTKAELGVGVTNDRQNELQRAVPGRHDDPTIGETLAREHSNLGTATSAERVSMLSELCRKYLVGTTSHGSDTEWLTELSLRIASDPARVEAWAGNKLKTGLTWLLELPAVLRAARFLVIAIDRNLHSRVTPGELYASWRWT